MGLEWEEGVEVREVMGVKGFGEVRGFVFDWLLVVRRGEEID